MATLSFAGEERDLRSVKVGFIGTPDLFAARLPIMECSAEDFAFAQHWQKRVSMHFEEVGRRELIEQQRKAGEVPVSRRGGKRFAGRCSYCLKPSDDLERDHIVPFSQGGGEDPDNLTPVCRTCNSKKKDMSLLQFVARSAS
jgi:hypothetical protein